MTLLWRVNVFRISKHGWTVNIGPLILNNALKLLDVRLFQGLGDEVDYIFVFKHLFTVFAAVGTGQHNDL